ncbi:MAG: Uma2 family endonuclease [Jiangellaceae bacterium]
MTAALQKPNLLDDMQDLTVDDLASLPEDLRYELIDGRLILPSPTGLHQLLGVELMLMLRPNCLPDYAPIIDLSLNIDRRNEPRPDVVVVHQRYMTRTPVPVDGALLVVEIISPTSHFRDMHAKTKIYAEAGVGTYWIVDPTFAGGVMLTEFRVGDDDEYEMVTSTNKVFETDTPYPVKIDLPALTELRDQYSKAEESGS